MIAVTAILFALSGGAVKASHCADGRYPWFAKVLASSAVASADLLASRGYQTVAFECWRNDTAPHGYGSPSQWYLLPDGSLMLAEFNDDALTPFGLNGPALGIPVRSRFAAGEIFAPSGTSSLPKE